MRGGGWPRHPEVVPLEVYTFAERPDLAEVGVPSVDVWPEYNLHGDVVNPPWGPLCDELPEFQAVVVDQGSGLAVAELHTGPLMWDGVDAHLPSGIDEALRSVVEGAREGRGTNTLCAMAAEISPSARGTDLASVAVEAMLEVARSHGYRHPDRPRPTVVEGALPSFDAPESPRPRPPSPPRPCWPRPCRRPLTTGITRTGLRRCSRHASSAASPPMRICSPSRPRLSPVRLARVLAIGIDLSRGRETGEATRCGTDDSSISEDAGRDGHPALSRGEDRHVPARFPLPTGATAPSPSRELQGGLVALVVVGDHGCRDTATVLHGDTVGLGPLPNRRGVRRAGGGGRLRWDRAGTALLRDRAVRVLGQAAGRQLTPTQGRPA